MSADIGLIGLAVMGENLVLNMERNGFTVAVFNRTTARVDEFVNTRGKDKKVRPHFSFSSDPTCPPTVCPSPSRFRCDFHVK
jgi:6-phosphogluconate dehydrogenase